MKTAKKLKTAERLKIAEKLKYPSKSSSEFGLLGSTYSVGFYKTVSFFSSSPIYKLLLVAWNS